MSTPPSPFPRPSVYPPPPLDPPAPAPTLPPPVVPATPPAPTISAPAAEPQVQPAPPAQPTAATGASRRRRGLLIAALVAAAVALVLVALLTRPTSGGKGEKFQSSPSLTPAKNFTPQSLHQALLSTAFPAGLLPSGFSFDAQRSPQGKAYAAQGFSTPEKTQQHHSVGTAAVALTSPTNGEAFQITFLSFAEPASAEAYMQEARNATGAQAPPGQPVCGAVSNGVIAGCSVQLDNVVVEGRAKSTNGQPLADVNGALATTNVLAQAGITHLHQVKGS